MLRMNLLAGSYTYCPFNQFTTIKCTNYKEAEFIMSEINALLIGHILLG